MRDEDVSEACDKLLSSLNFLSSDIFNTPEYPDSTSDDPSTDKDESTSYVYTGSQPGVIIWPNTGAFIGLERSSDQVEGGSVGTVNARRSGRDSDYSAISSIRPRLEVTFNPIDPEPLAMKLRPGRQMPHMFRYVYLVTVVTDEKAEQWEAQQIADHITKVFSYGSHLSPIRFFNPSTNIRKSTDARPNTTTSFYVNNTDDFIEDRVVRISDQKGTLDEDRTIGAIDRDSNQITISGDPLPFAPEPDIASRDGDSGEIDFEDHNAFTMTEKPSIDTGNQTVELNAMGFEEYVTDGTTLVINREGQESRTVTVTIVPSDYSSRGKRVLLTNAEEIPSSDSIITIGGSSVPRRVYEYNEVSNIYVRAKPRTGPGFNTPISEWRLPVLIRLEGILSE